LTPQWTTALPDWDRRIVAGWDRRIVAGQSLLPCGPLFPDEASASLGIFGGLRLSDVPGGPTIDAVSRSWVMDFARAVFGSYNPESGERLIRYFFLLVAKKNSKSTLVASLTWWKLPMAVISSGDVIGLCHQIKNLLGRGDMQGLPAVNFA
jgi:phage terminase large subunit-like protein